MVGPLAAQFSRFMTKCRISLFGEIELPEFINPLTERLPYGLRTPWSS